MKLLTATAVLFLAPAPSQDLPEPARPEAQHEWLQQLVGEWEVTTEAIMEEGAEPTTLRSTESVRAVGELWIQAEGSATLGGMPLTSILTIGYDPEQKAFVGTWIDTMHTYLWSYLGSLDEAKKVLTLETEGPSVDDPTKRSRYRDVITIVDSDHKTLTSSMLGEDGSWTTFMTARYTRRK